MIRRVAPSSLVFLDESGLNVSMTRSHAWVKKGCEYIERTPMNWGKNLTLLGAMRLTGWVLLNTMFASTSKERFVEWLAKLQSDRARLGAAETAGPSPCSARCRGPPPRRSPGPLSDHPSALSPMVCACRLRGLIPWSTQAITGVRWSCRGQSRASARPI